MGLFNSRMERKYNDIELKIKDIKISKGGKNIVKDNLTKFKLISFVLFAIIIVGCDSQGKKAADEYYNCAKQSIENASSLEDVQEKMKDCVKEIQKNYSSKITDKNFQKDFEEEMVKKNTDIQELMKKKFNK